MTLLETERARRMKPGQAICLPTFRVDAPVSSHLSRIEHVVLNQFDARIAGCASADFLLANERGTFPIFMSSIPLATH
jgi:hypothetical protein